MTDEAEKLRALATRCEQATGPDRELDAQIREVAGVHPRFVYARRYTASLDAAMTLCSQPPSFDIDHDHMTQGGKWNCLVGDDEGFVPNGRAEAATPALALTAAALRARASEVHHG